MPGDQLELSYQWPPWVLGPEWQLVKPIYIKNVEDMSLFMAIRMDLKGLRLRVKLVQWTPDRNVYSYRSGIGMGDAGRGEGLVKLSLIDVT